MSLLLLGCHRFQALSADRVRIHIHYTHKYAHVYIYMYIHMHVHRHTSITTTSVFSSIYSILKHKFKPVCPVPIQYLKAFCSRPTFPYLLQQWETQLTISSVYLLTGMIKSLNVTGLPTTPAIPSACHISSSPPSTHISGTIRHWSLPSSHDAMHPSSLRQLLHASEEREKVNQVNL